MNPWTLILTEGPKGSRSDPATRTEAITIIRTLIERVALHPADGGFEIELVGDLAQMGKRCFVPT